MRVDAGRKGLRGWPIWVWVLIAALGATQILTHALIAKHPPQGTVPTGMTIPDSALFLQAMRMFPSHFESLYATCQAPHGRHYVGYFPFSLLWPYGMLGWAAEVTRLNAWAVYAAAAALSTAFYLASVYGFMRTVARRHANAAFTLFALSGGLGGALYLLSGCMGWHGAAGFDAYFQRFAMYELFEGPHVFPATCYPRLYYTFSLGACLVALTLVIQMERNGMTRWRALLALALMFAGAAVNLRSGVFVWGAGVVYLWRGGESPLQRRIALGILFLPALACGALITRQLLSFNPDLASNLINVANMAVWFSPLLSVIALHLFITPREIQRRYGAWSIVTRLCVAGAAGYFAGFALLFAAYQLYYGNVLICRDAAVAERISDVALIGACAGAWLAWRAWRKRSDRVVARDAYEWIALWLLAYGALSISAFGQGWFLRFGPHRLQVLIWLPLCIISAAGLERWISTGKRWAAWGAWSVLITAGVCSIITAILFFQSPLGRVNAEGPYRRMHAEVMTEADARVQDQIGPGYVLAMPPASDAVVFRRGNPVVYGNGSFNLSDRSEIELRAMTERFFSMRATDAERREVVRTWCVDYVYCADTWPVPDDVIGQLAAADWLEEVAREGRAVLFRVKDGADSMDARGDRELAH